MRREVDERVPGIEIFRAYGGEWPYVFKKTGVPFPSKTIACLKFSRLLQLYEIVL